jgi:hypothetical protein
MEKPHLEITLLGKFSACSAYFIIGGYEANNNPAAGLKALQAQFDKHVQKAHMDKKSRRT